MTFDLYFGAKETADEHVFGLVLANELTARTMAQFMIDRGCKINMALDDMTHEQIVDFCLEVMTTLALRERAS